MTYFLSRSPPIRGGRRCDAPSTPSDSRSADDRPISVTMKTFLLAISIALFCTALPRIGHAGVTDTAKAIKFMKSKRPCSAWWMAGLVRSDSNIAPRDAQTVADQVTCISYGSLNAGTVNEKKGCMAGVFDLAEGTFNAGRIPVFIEGKKCTPDVVEKLMNHPFMGHPSCSNRKLIIGGDAKLQRVLKARFVGPDRMCSFV